MTDDSTSFQSHLPISSVLCVNHGDEQKQIQIIQPASLCDTDTHRKTLVVISSSLSEHPPSVQAVIDACSVRCMLQRDAVVYFDHEAQSRAPPFQLEPKTLFPPSSFNGFTTAWWALWCGGNARSADERWILENLVKANGSCPVQIMQDDHILVTRMLKRFGTPPPAVQLLNLYIRAMGCRLETVWAFGEWVDAANKEKFAAFAASHPGPVFEPKRQVVGFAQMSVNILKATAASYSALEHVLRAETGSELKRRILQLEGLGEYRGHVLFSFLAMTRLTPLVGRNGTWTDTHFTGPGARKGLKHLQGQWTVESIQRDPECNPLRLSLDDVEHCFCAFQKFLKHRTP